MADFSDSCSDQEILLHDPQDDFSLTEKLEMEAFPLSKTPMTSKKKYRSDAARSREDRSPVQQRGKEKESRSRRSKDRLSGETLTRKSSNHGREREGTGRRNRDDYKLEDREYYEKVRERSPLQSRESRHRHKASEREDSRRSKGREGRIVEDSRTRHRSPHHHERPSRREDRRADYSDRSTKTDERKHYKPSHDEQTTDRRIIRKVSSSSDTSDSDSMADKQAKRYHDSRNIHVDMLLRDLASGSSGDITSSSDSESESEQQIKKRGQSNKSSGRSQADSPRGFSQVSSDAVSGSSGHEEGELEQGQPSPLTAEEVARRGRWYSNYDEDLDSDKSRTAEDIEEAAPPVVFDSEAEKEKDDSYEGNAEENTEEKEAREEENVRTPSPELPPYTPATMGCRNVENYEWLNRIEEGTYGVVYRARDKKTGEIVALKKLKMEKEKEGFPITSLREINMLMKAKHPNIVHVREIVVGSNMDKIYIVMDYVEHDLKALMETMKQPFLEGEVKTLTIQLLRAVHHLHDNWILHRDLKASNLLLSHNGILKVGDFGLAREYGSPLLNYTPVVVTLWYRSPELLLGSKEYSTAVDMWSVGCIFAEFLLHKPLFRGKSEIDQLNQIFSELGTPNDDIWPGYSSLPIAQKTNFAKKPYNNLRKKFPYLTKSGFDLLNRFLTYDPKKRISAESALKHVYFEESPLPVDPSMFPTWPAKSEMVKRPRERSPTAPEGGAFLLKQRGEADEEKSLLGQFRLTSAQHGQAAVGAGFSLKF